MDDGSPDNCPALCDAAAEKDSRVRVIHQQNKGLSGARNAGINVARGNWLGVVDSDDMIDPTCCEKMLHAAAVSYTHLCVTSCDDTAFLKTDGEVYRMNGGVLSKA